MGALTPEQFLSGKIQPFPLFDILQWKEDGGGDEGRGAV